jgi:Holliday junction resolvase RusA-like endonuclease
VVGSLKIFLPVPPSNNAYWRAVVRPKKGGGFRAFVILTDEAEAYKVAVQSAFRRVFGLQRRPLEGPIELGIVWHRKIRSGDLSNRIKVLEDSLQHLAFENDSQVVRIVAERVDGGEPGVWVTVTPVGEQQETLV